MEIANENAHRQWPMIGVGAPTAAGAGSTDQAQASARGPTHISRAVPALLGFVAGYVDSCTFLAFNGLFVAQATGSFVVVGSQFVRSNDGFVIKVLAIPAFFGAGMVVTVIVTVLGVGDRRALVTALALEASLLVGLAWVGLSAASMPAASIAALFGLSAMGVQSALSRLMLSEYGSTNVMTTNTTQLSIDVTETILARRRDRDASSGAAASSGRIPAHVRLSKLAPIMLGFLSGTVAGGLAYISAGLVCLVMAIAIVAVLAIWAALPRAQPR